MRPDLARPLLIAAATLMIGVIATACGGAGNRVVSDRHALPAAGRVLGRVSAASAPRAGIAPARLATGQAAIVFSAVSPGENDSELLRILPSGRGLQRLTRDRFNEDAPAWSPDRQRIAFSRETLPAAVCQRTCSVSIWTMSPAGTRPIRVTRPPSNSHGNLWFDQHPDWSPNGRRLVFERDLPDAGSLMTVARNGSHLRRIVPLSDFFPSYPAWGPRGLFAVTAGMNSDLYVVRTDGSHLRKLVSNTTESALTSPIWDSSGSRIAYGVPGAHRINIVSASTGANLQTISLPASVSPVSISASPDFRTFVFSSETPPAPPRLYLVGSDGRNLRQLGAGNVAMSRLSGFASPAWH